MVKKMFFPLIEFILASAIAFIFHYSLKDETAALSIIGMGWLLSLSTFIMYEEFIDEFNGISTIYRLRKCIHETKNAEVVNKALQIEKDFISKMNKLSKGIINFTTSNEIYLCLQNQVRNTKKAIKCTSFINQIEWERRVGLKNYFNEQIKALRKGINIHRIFILDEEEKKDKKVQEIIKKHVEYKEHGLNVYIANRKEIPESLIKDIAIFDDRVLFEAVIHQGQIIGGKKTIDSSELNKGKEIFDLLLKNYAIHIDNSDIAQYIAIPAQAQSVKN